MTRVPDPPDLVRTLAYIRRTLRAIPAESAQRATIFTCMRVTALALTASAIQDLAEQPTTTPEDTLRDAGVSTRRQATYQRRFSTLLAGRAKAGA